MKINNFKELFNEIFYDWGMTPNPQIHKEKNGFWINKTSIVNHIGKSTTLTYKLDEYTILDSVMDEFTDFYKDYENDREFEAILNHIQDFWFNNKLKLVNEEFLIGNFKLYKKDLKFYYSLEETEVEISKILFIKTNNFLKKCLNN